MTGFDYLVLSQINGSLYKPEDLEGQLVERASRAIKRGHMWRARPAMTVFFDGGHYWAADFFHRIEAAQRERNHYCEFWCEIKAGSRQSAIAFGRSAVESMPQHVPPTHLSSLPPR